MPIIISQARDRGRFAKGWCIHSRDRVPVASSALPSKAKAIMWAECIGKILGVRVRIER